MRVKDLFRLLRPWQWYKNFIVFIPLIFSNNAFAYALYKPAALTFAAFCLLASGHYAWNDVRDRKADAQHPYKRARPVARGAVGAPTALALGFLLTTAGLALLLLTNPPTLFFGLCYVVLQLGYTLWLKDVVLVDLIVIGLGFVLRAVAGTTAIEVGEPTQWLILVTFLFALFLGLTKRRHELILLEPADAASSRTTLQRYTLAYTEQMTSLTAGLLLTAYFLYTFFGTTPWMMLTIPFAVFGVFRYLLLVHRHDLRSEAQLLFRDRAIVVAAILWAATAVLVLRGLPQDAFQWLEGLAP